MTMQTHYAIGQVESIEDIRDIFPDGQANEYNWLVCSTSGVHGSSDTLTDIEAELLHERSLPDGDWFRDITVLVMQPRLVRLLYGNARITLDDIPYLRGLVRSSLEVIARTQEGNT